MGKLKRRVHPSEITINIGKQAPIPECPIPGERWKEVKHDNTVTWLAYWNDPINPKEFKYVFLAANSSLKGKSDKEKYEKARLLKDYIDNIRATYTKDFTIKDIMKRQIAVATYLIDKLALRAGNEKWGWLKEMLKVLTWIQEMKKTILETRKRLKMMKVRLFWLNILETHYIVDALTCQILNFVDVYAMNVWIFKL